MNCKWCTKYINTKITKRRKYCSDICYKTYNKKYGRKKKWRPRRERIWAPHQGRTILLKSGYEIDYVKYLDKCGIKWYYEIKKFYLNGIGRIYIPDFYLPDENKYVEVKGRWMKKSKIKFELFKKEYPNETIEVVGPAEIKKIRRQMGIK